METFMKIPNPFPKFARRFAGGLLLAALAGTLAACSSVSSRSTHYVGEQAYPPGYRGAMMVLGTEPMHSHVQLGEIEVDACTSPAPPPEKIEAKLRKEAAKLGADAVVIVFDRIQPTALYVTDDYWHRSV